MEERTIMNAEKKLELYKNLYEKINKRVPIITKNGPWMKLTDDNTVINFRTKDLPEMIVNLMGKMKDVISSLTDNNIFGRQWIEYINSDLIYMLLDKIFEECGNSEYGMELYLKDAVLGNKIFNEDCLVLEEEVEKLRDRVEELERANKILNKTVKQRDKYIKRLKENSVVFTMDDI